MLFRFIKRSDAPSNAYTAHMPLLILTATCLVGGLAAIVREPLALESIAKALAMPCGFVWLLLIGMCVASWHVLTRGLRVGFLLIIAVYSAAGNEQIGGLLLWQLQREFDAIDPFQRGTFDAIVVLGGTTATAPNGQPQVSGDRVVLAARMYHAGKTRCLVTTGERIAMPGSKQVNQADETQLIWRDLGIPDNRIVKVGGRNTDEEMQQIRDLMHDKHWPRVGLITSAWHLPRAMRLADRYELNLEALPTNFVGMPSRLTLISLIPSAAGLDGNSLVIKELLAAHVGR